MSQRRERFVGLAGGLAAAAAFALSELVLWSGQPGDGATGADVVRYYGDHGARVQLGDLLWSAGAVALVAAAVVVGRSMLPSIRVWFVGVSTLAAGLLVASAAVAFVIAMRAGTLTAPSAHTLWWTEGLLFGIGARLLAVPLLAAVVDGFRRGAAGVTMGVLAAILAVDAMVQLLAPWGFLAVSVWFGLAALLLGAAPRSHMKSQFESPRADQGIRRIEPGERTKGKAAA